MRSESNYFQCYENYDFRLKNYNLSETQQSLLQQFSFCMQLRLGYIVTNIGGICSFCSSNRFDSCVRRQLIYRIVIRNLKINCKPLSTMTMRLRNNFLWYPLQRSLRYFAKAATKSHKLDIYERKSPIEHVLLRPSMYIGEVEFKTSDTWIYNDDLKCMEKTTLTYSPALIKVVAILYACCCYLIKLLFIHSIFSLLDTYLVLIIHNIPLFN